MHACTVFVCVQRITVCCARVYISSYGSGTVIIPVIAGTAWVLPCKVRANTIGLGKQINVSLMSFQ